MKFLHCRFLLCSSMKTFTMSRSSGAVNFGCGSGRATAAQGCTHGGAWPRRGCCGRREGRRRRLLLLHGRPRSTERRQRCGRPPRHSSGVGPRLHTVGRPRARQQERRPRVARGAAAGAATATRRSSEHEYRQQELGAERRQQDACFYFFVCQKCFGTGWSFQPVPMDV